MRQLLGLLIITVCIGFILPAIAADRPNLLIMGEDTDANTVPRNSRVFRRVLANLSSKLHSKGYDVFDEPGVTFEGGKFEQGRSRRSNDELLGIARSIKTPPIDVVVLFSIYVQAKDKGYTTKIKVNIDGRMLHAQSGQFLGTFSVKSPKQWNAPPRCNRDCLLDTAMEYSSTLANDLGAVLEQKLSAMYDPASLSGANKNHSSTTTQNSKNNQQTIASAYNLVFDNFGPDDMLSIEEYLVIFSGYKAHRPVYSSATRSELWYQSTINTAKLSRNLQKMLAHLELRGAVQFSGNTFTIQQVTLRNESKRRVADDDWE